VCKSPGTFPFAFGSCIDQTSSFANTSPLDTFHSGSHDQHRRVGRWCQKKSHDPEGIILFYVTSVASLGASSVPQTIVTIKSFYDRMKTLRRSSIVPEKMPY
jgi:hypothetical protein